MTRRVTRTRCELALSLGILLGSGCETSDVSAPSASLIVQAAFSVRDTTRDAFSLPIPGLSASQLAGFFVGNSFFNQSWVMAPASVRERDGLGPLFNARSCSGCHFKDGRGRPPEPGELPRGFLLRIGVPGESAHAATSPDPVYGDQLQTDALPGLRPEVELRISYEETLGSYADGDSFQLRRPAYILEKPGFGPLSADLKLSARVAPQMLGLGLLEAVPEHELARTADPDDRDGDGISGRVQRVLEVESGSSRVGRFGWKAEQASLRAQVAAAFVADMGITSALFPAENHSIHQLDAAQYPSGGRPELTPNVLDKVVLYLRTLALPAPRRLAAAEASQGAELFAQARCDACHLPSLHTGRLDDLPQLSQQTFQPFTDLLLHDMGESLSDARPSFAAEGREWRTPPLWGIGLIAKVNGHQLLLHDGRARGVAEAILWHAGEADSARRVFVQMSRAQRRALVAFVESL